MPDFTRNAELACIHIAKDQLGFDDDIYRDFLFVHTGQRSAATLNKAQRKLIIERMRALGFRRIEPAAKPRNPGLGQEQKIRAIWQALNEAGALRNPTEKGLRAFIKRQTGGVKMPNWLTAEQANKVIEGLKAMQKRKAEEDARDEQRSGQDADQ